MLSKFSERRRTAEGNGEQLVSEEHPPGKHRHSYQHQPAEMPSPMSDRETLSIRTSKSKDEVHDFDAIVDSNFPYLHGAQSYKLKKSRRNTTSTTTIDSLKSIGTNCPLPSSPNQSKPRVASIRTLKSQSSEVSVLHTSSGSQHNQKDKMNTTPSTTRIEIGSLQSLSSVNSEELRLFYNGVGT